MNDKNSYFKHKKHDTNTGTCSTMVEQARHAVESGALLGPPGYRCPRVSASLYPPQEWQRQGQRQRMDSDENQCDKYSRNNSCSLDRKPSGEPSIQTTEQHYIPSILLRWTLDTAHHITDAARWGKIISEERNETAAWERVLKQRGSALPELLSGKVSNPTATIL